MNTSCATSNDDDPPDTSWSAEEEALINEFEAILSTTARNLLVKCSNIKIIKCILHKVETTRRLLFPTDLPEEETVHLGSKGRLGKDEPTSNFFPVERADMPRSTHSTTSRQDVNMIESRTSRVSDMEASPSTPRIFTSKPTSFSDILPPQSINPPKLVGAKSFNELLQKPTIINNIEDPFQPSSNLRSSNEQIEMDKRKQMIKEALERIKKNRIKLENVRNLAPSEGDKGRIITEGGDTMRFQPVPSIQQGPGDR